MAHPCPNCFCCKDNCDCDEADAIMRECLAFVDIYGGDSEDCNMTACPYELGDTSGDGGWNVLDIVALANCLLANSCHEMDTACAADMNGDGGYNVLDIVTLANCVLADSCGG